MRSRICAVKMRQQRCINYLKENDRAFELHLSFIYLPEITSEW